MSQQKQHSLKTQSPQKSSLEKEQMKNKILKQVLLNQSLTPPNPTEQEREIIDLKGIVKKADIENSRLKQ